MNMNLDELITEMAWEHLNNVIKQNKILSNLGPTKKEKEFDQFEYAEGTQEAYEKKIEDYEKKIEYYKKEKNFKKVKEYEEKIEKLKEKIEKFKEKFVSRLKKAAIKEKLKEKGIETNATIKSINALKGKICFLMMDYVNLTSGVGLNGDHSLTNDVKVSKTKKIKEGYLEGYQKTIVSGVPSAAEIKKYYNMLKEAVEQLKKYEYGYYKGETHYHGAPKTYFDDKQERSKVLLKALENIKPEDISFDPDSQEIPISTDAAMVKTGKETGRNSGSFDEDGNPIRDKYAKINGLKVDSEGNIKTRISQIKSARVLGKKRFNAFVYEELQPYIHEFQKFRKDWQAVGDPQNFPTTDFIANNTKDGFEKRVEKANMYANWKGKFSDFKKTRKAEQQIGKISDAKNERDEDGKIDNSRYSAIQGAGMKALRNQIYGQARTDTQSSKTGNQGWLEAHHIEKLNLSKVKKIINGWIDAGKEPSVKDKTIIKFFGVMPGTAGQGGAGTLIFMHTDKPAPDQFSYEGLYAFKAGKSFMNGDLSSAQEKYVESHAGRKADAWKKGVLEALKKYDTEGNATVYTEEVNSYYFNY